MEQNDKNLQGIYNTLKKEGYNPPLYDVFVKDMQDDNNLQGVRNTLVKHGYTPPEFDEFKADMFGTPAPKSTPAHQQQANLATAAGTIPASVSSPVQPAEQPAPVQSAPEKPSWQPSEQEKIRMPYQMHTMLNDFNQKSKERIGQIQRLSEPLTPEGRQKRRALEFQAQLAGSPTKVLGLTPRTNATVPDGEQGGVVEGAAQQQPEQSGQSPVPYGVKYIDGKPVTQWLLPDGRLTTSLMEADQAEYGARTARQATSISFQIQKAETELAELQKQYEDSKSRVQEEWAEEHKRNKAPLAAVLASRTYVPRQHGDKGNSALLVAIRQKEEQIKDLIEERDRQSGKDVGFWRGFGRIVSDFRTWDLGMGDLSDAMTMLNAKHYSSPKATEDERKAGEAMMKALYDRQETENLYGGNTSWWNRAGGMTGHMPAFILDFALTGGGYGSVAKVGAKTAAKQSVKLFGKRAIEEMAGLGVKEYAKQYGVRGVGRMAGNWTVKALGTTTDDLLVRAPLMANTIQGGKTAADIIDRKLGDVVIDENGNYDFSNDKTWGSAVWQGEANSIIENYSEMFGSHIDGLTPMLAKTFGGKRISGMLARANASGFGQVLNTTRKQFQHLGVSDYIGEVAEEYYGQLWRTMLNLDDAYTDVPIFDEQGNPMIDEHGNPVTGRKNLLFTGQFHGDIWGGMALSMGLMGAGKYTLTGVGYANMKREVNKVDRMASQVLGHDEWEVLRETIDNTTNEDMGALAENVINDSSLSEEERAAVMVYMERSLNLRGLNLATLAKNRGAETDGPVTLEDVYQPNPHTDGETSSHFTPEQADAQRLYSEGRELYGRFEDSDPTVQADVDAISLRMQEAYQAVEDVFGAEAEYYMFHVNENPWALVNDPELTAEQQDAVLYYINAKAALDGVMDASNEAADRKRAEVEQSVGKRTHKDKGVIIPAETKMGKQVYIVKGDIVMFPDGSAVDVRNSSESVVVMDSQTGEYEFTSPDQIFQVSEAVNPQDELDTALSVIEQEQMSVFGQNAIAPEEPAEGEAPIDQSADVSPEPAPETASTEEYDRGYEQGLEDAAKADDAWIANLIKIYSQNTPESMPETMKGRLDAFLYEQQRRAQSVPETPENVPNPTENAISDTEIVPEAVSNVENGQQTALSRIPLNEQGEPRFEAVDKDTAWDGLVEAVGGETDAADIAMAQVQQASTDLEALKKKQPTQKAPKLKGSPMAMAQAKREAAEQYQRDLAQYNQQIADTEARLATWNGIVGVYTSRNAELRRQQEEERRQRDAIAHDEAVARFEEEQRIKAEKKAEQERIGVHAVNPKIRERWESAPKVEGNEDALTLPDGSTISGRYILTEAGAASPSHDVNNAYAPTEGFPIDENGQSVNDRDYQCDKDAQQKVEGMAGNYDNRALQDPVIVSKDGVVLSGNNRTMSGDLAARQGTDRAYNDYLTQFGHKKYGFTPEQVASMRNPRVVFVPDEALPYDATTFARFNAQEKKSQGKPEAAVKLGKIVPDNVFTSIVNNISRYDRLSDYYADEKAIAHALGALMEAGVINDMQMPEMRTGTALSATGKELIENTLIGKVFQTSPDAVRQIISMPTLRQSIVMGLNEIANNRTLARNDYDISEELAKAVDIVTRAKSAMPDVYTDGMPVSPFGRMQGLFDDEFGDSRVADATALLLADILNSGKPSDLRKVLTSYNNDAAQASGGQLDIFSGSIPTKEEILTNVNEHFRNATPKEQQALVEAAIAERKRRAEAEAERRGRGQESEQTQNDVERSAEPQQPVASTCEELTPEKQALAARVEITENDWEEGDGDKPTYKREIIVDGTHKVTQVDAPNEDGHYTGSYFEFDGKRFGDIAEITQYIDGHPSARLKVDGGMQSEPTEAQKAAGNYKMEHRKVDGYNVSIENVKGSVRRGKSADGTEWQTTMQNDYGYIRGTQGVDGDHIDVFLSDTPDEGDVFVVDQVNEDGSFDEHKVMYGFPSEEAARDAYLSNYEQGWTGLGAITHVSKEEFKKWIQSSKRKTKPFAEYKSVKPILYDNQGNPIDENGNLIIENVKSIVDITDADFTEPTRTVGLPALPEIVQQVLSTNGKRIIIKKNIFERNALRHDELTPDMSRAILNEALYNPTLYGKNKPLSRPNNWIVINVPDGKGNNKLVVLEVNENKDNVEIVHWHEADKRGLEKIKRQAQREDGQLLILPSETSEEAGALSGPTFDSPSDGKVNTLSADKQMDGAESSELYTITPTSYTNKKGKTSDVHLVKFNRELTKEEKSALDTFVREPLAEGKKTPRGWYDRKQGGYMMRSEEAARKLGEMIGNEEAIADAQPMTAEELREAVAPATPAEKKPAKPKKSPINRVSLEDVMTDLSTKGETKLSDHAEPVKKEPETQHEISDDEMQSLANELRELLGIGEDEGDADIKFRDPGELTPQERQRIQSAGIRFAMGLVERGTTSFPDYATKMVGLLGDKIRPWLKSFYEGARWTPGYEKYDFTPTEQVAVFDVQNFDKKQADPIAQAAMIVEERKASTASAQAQKELIETRNKNRRENDKQTEADTAALAEKAEAVAGEAESIAETSADASELNRASELIDQTLDDVNDQLAILGYYEAEQIDKDFNEAYGYMRNAEKKAVKDAVNLAKQLVNDLGLEVDKVVGSTTAKQGKKHTAVSANIAPAGGDISIRLPLNEGRELYVTIGLDPSVTPGDVTYSGDNLQATRIMYRIEWPDEKGRVSIDRMGRNCWSDANVTYAELLKGIQREAGDYLPEPSAEKRMQELSDMADRGESPYSVTPEVEAQFAEQRKSDVTYNGYRVGDEVIWDRYGNGKWEKRRIIDFDKDGRPILDSFGQNWITELADRGRIKPVDGVFGEAQRIARAALEKKKTTVTTGERPKKSLKKDVTLNSEQTVGDLFGGIFDNTQNTINHERTDLGTRPGETGGQRQQLKQDTQVGGNESRRETERLTRTAGSRSSGMDTDADRNGGRRVSRLAEAATLSHISKSKRKNVHNNYVERGTDTAPKSIDARIKANIEAIETLKRLRTNGEEASAEDMKKLRAFSGWGGLGKAFSDWSTQRRLKELIGERQFEVDAQLSRNSAYFTPAYVVDAMWDIARALGFKGGRILEGSAGVGNVLGLMPRDFSERSSIHAVEKDTTTGGILSLLYPDADVDVKGFEDTKIENGSIDLAITNVPFVPGLHVKDSTCDRDLSNRFKDIHNFCIAKNVRKLRDGGIGIFITTAGTLDSTGKLYRWLTTDGNSDIVGLFRMHNETFGGTNATSDIIVVRKRVGGVKSPHAIDASHTTGVRVAEYDTGGTRKKAIDGVKVTVPVINTLSMSYNRYFVEHPEHMAGEMKFGFEAGDTYRPKGKSLYPSKDKDQGEMLKAWVAEMQGKVFEEADQQPTTNYREAYIPIYDKVGNEVKTGTVVIDSNGRICVNYDGQARPLMSDFNARNPKSEQERIAQFNKGKVKGRTRVQVIADYNAIKKTLAEVLYYEKTNDSDTELQRYLDALNKAFDNFVATYGHLHGNNGLAWLRADVDYPSVLALETYREEGIEHTKVFGKADIFSRRVVTRVEQPKPANVKDGVILSIRQHGQLDVTYIAGQLGIGEDKVRRQIIEAGLGFENPLTHGMEASHEYLSGNVREKLRQAEENNDNGRYAPNIAALRKVVPQDIPSHFIEFSIGSSWIRPEIYEEYIKERTGAKVKLTYAVGQWAMERPKRSDISEQDKSYGVKSEKCNKIIPGHVLMEAAMTNRTIRVSTTIKGYAGKDETISDPVATSACAAKVDEIRDDFKTWLRNRMNSNPEFAKEIEETYNSIFNNSAPMTIPDEYIPEYFDGASRVIGGKHIKLRSHQAKAVVRGTMQSLMFAHEVGTGKTFTLITTAMEMRRLGTAKKPMIVVQNATLGQFVASAKALYPDARILSLEDRDRNAQSRKDFYAKIRYNDWDMVVIPQSVLEKIPDHPDRERQFIEESIDEKLEVIEAMQSDRENARLVGGLKKEVEKMRERLAAIDSETPTEEPDITSKKKDGKKTAVTRENARTRAEEMLDRATDDTLNFDDLGVDAILVDEAHEYKHLGFATAMQRGIKGVDPSYSKKCQGLFLKVKAVQEMNAGRNVIFATGTPISNTAAEIWTFMRYLLPRETMEEHNIWHFDDFVRNFGSIQQMLEFTTAGKYKENNRFAGYTNLPELARIWAGIADTVLTAEAGEVKSQIPELEGGKPTDIYLPQTAGLRAVIKYVKKELEAFERMSGQEKKENSHIPLTMYGIAKAAAIDARLVMPNAPDDMHSKTNECVRQTLRSLKDSGAYKGTVAIFADNYQRKNRQTGVVEFNLFMDIRDKLIAEGVPAEQIMVMRDGLTDKKKEEIFTKVNAGEIRVILGTTPRLGVGVNIQERLHTLMHIDAPNRPMDYWQRMGRLLRQGNLHKEMDIPVRVIRFGVEDSLDVTAYQRLKTKGAIADAVMNSKTLLLNNLENRVLEEEGDEFGNITAELSGSEYAILQNQTEKELRKLLAKQDQHRQHQMYIHRTEPRLRGQIRAAEECIEKNDNLLARISEADGNVIEVNGKKYQAIEDMEDVFKVHNKSIAGRRQKADQGDTTNSVLHFSIGGIPFELHTTVLPEVDFNGNTRIMTSQLEQKLLCPDLFEESVNVQQSNLKKVINFILNEVVTGKWFKEDREYAVNSKVRCEADLATLLKDKGKEFEHSDRIKELQEKLVEYTEALQKDLAEKEAKYAEIDAETEEADGIVFTSGVEDDADEFFTKDEGKFRDGDGMTYGERLRAIRALEPISVERNNLSRSELREVYSNLPSVEKDGREIGFYHSAFKKIYKEGGLFGQVVPVLDEVLGQSVLAYSEEDNLGGKVRPDGTIHKNHPNVESFDNYVGKIKLDGRDYYVRTTVKREIGQAGTHSFFITDVELYEKTVVGLTLPNFPSGESSLQRPVNPIESRTIPITSRGTTDIDGIVDAKLLKFFERASLEALELDKKDRVEELSDRLGIPVRVITKAEEIDELPSARHRRSKGYWRSKDGVVIILPNNNDVADVDNTFVHEVVGHKGLRGLIGEGRFDEFLSEVYSHASNPIRKVIDKKTDGMVNAEADRLRVRKAQAHERAGKDVNANYYTDMAEARVEAEAKRKDFRKEATEEYMADLAGRIGSEGFEKMSRDELTLWGKIKAKVQSFLDKFLSGLKIAKSIRLNDKDLSYILFKSWKNMRDKQGKGGVFADAEDAVMRHRTGWGEAMLSESAKIEDANNRFNKELQRQVDGNLPDGHIYQLGMPSNILRSTGVPNLPIQMSATRLRAKATEYGHDFDLAEIRNLVKELQTPMAVFAYGNKGKMQNIIVGIESNGKQFIVGLSLNPIVNGKALEINSVRNVFPKHNAEWLNWISQGKLLYADKQKIQALIDKQRTILADVDYLDLEDVAKVIKTFENPTFDGDEDVRFRDGADYVERVPVMARAMYEKQIQSSMYQFTEAMQDSMRGLMEFYKAVESQGAKRDIEDVSSFENAYIAENLMSSKSHAEMDEYEHRILRPLLDIAARMSGDKRGREELLDYMMAKHGLERNAYMRNEAIANGEESERDFAGLCGLTGETDWQNAEIVAQQMVDDYEAAHSTDIPALWSAVNKATKTSLQKIYNCGLISKAQYEKIRDMYNFYIPLQGFDEKTSDDVYGYLTSKKGAFSSPIKKAEGRKSKADDPLATIAYMAQNSIIQGNRNVMKQKFLTYVQNHPSDLASVNKLWLVHDEITDTWKPVFADVDENMTPDEIDKVVMDFEERMESLSQSEPDKYKRGRDAIGIPYRIVDGNIKEHQVVVKRNGESYVITINGNPRAAQAVNGLTNPDNDLNGAIGKVFNIASTVNRELSQLYTTRNPDFVVSNFIRDLIYSNTMVHVKENQGYAMRFHKNHAKVNPIRMVELLHLYEANKLDMRNPMHRMFYEFMHWGGETGYTLQRNLEQEKKLVSKIMKEARRGQLNPMSILGLIGNNLDQINRAVENSARFAAFITSREVGRDVQRSAYDAKEISVNFNKKGAGSKFMDATGQTFAGKAAGFTSGLGRSFYVFWNAAIQGTANFGKAFRKHPVKSITAATSLLLLGYIMALLADDGDDEDKNGYYNVPKYTRRSNLMFRFGEQWLTIPLPVEYRAIYGLGELAYSVTSGREEYSDAELAKETASQLSQLLPLDFMEGGGGLHAFVPSAFKPMVETATNTSWTGLPIYKNTPFNKNMPEWTKAYPRTNTQLVELSRWANEASGGNNYAAGWANFNPAQLEYLLNGYFGGYSNVINKMVKTGETMLGEREYDPSSILLVNRLVKMGDERTAEKKINSDFFKYLEEYRRTHTLLRKYEDEAERGSDRYSIFLDALKHSRDGARHDVMDEYITDYNWLNRATKDSEIADEERATYEEEMRRLKREVVSLMKVAHDSVQVNKMKERFAEEYIQQ